MFMSRILNTWVERALELAFYNWDLTVTRITLFLFVIATGGRSSETGRSICYFVEFTALGDLVI